MTFPGGIQAGAVQRCRVCAAEVPADAARCPRCDAALGAHDPCPSCRAQAGASPHRELRYVCDVCGAPRVPRLDKAMRYSGREMSLLRKADEARKGRALWRGAAAADGVLLLCTLAIVSGLLVIFGASALLVLGALLPIAALGTFLAFAASRAGAHARAIQPAIDAAWLSVATDIAQQTPDLNAGTLARKLGIEEPQAEELMALLDVNGVMSPAKLRIAAGAAPGATQVAAAEEEAALAEQIAAEAAARAQGGAPPGKP